MPSIVSRYLFQLVYYIRNTASGCRSYQKMYVVTFNGINFHNFNNPFVLHTFSTLHICFYIFAY